MLKIFVQKTIAIPDTNAFGKYFIQHYVPSANAWAFYHRLWAQINTNMHLESVHKTLKYFYLSGKRVKRLDKGIHAMMHFIRDKIFDRIITLEKGKVTSKLKDLRARHKRSLEISLGYVLENDDGWLVPSEKDSTEFYMINKTGNCEGCHLKCSVTLASIYI